MPRVTGMAARHPLMPLLARPPTGVVADPARVTVDAGLNRRRPRLPATRRPLGGIAFHPDEPRAVTAGATMIEHTTVGHDVPMLSWPMGTKCQPSTILRLTAEHSPGG